MNFWRLLSVPLAAQGPARRKRPTRARIWSHHYKSEKNRAVRRFLQVLILQSVVAIVLTATAAIFLVAGLGTRKLRRLADISDRPVDNPQFLSVGIAARHEAEHLLVRIANDGEVEPAAKHAEE